MLIMRLALTTNVVLAKHQTTSRWTEKLGAHIFSNNLKRLKRMGNAKKRCCVVLSKRFLMMAMKIDKDGELLPEYDLDYSKSKPNHFAAKYQQMQRTVVLDSDIADKFPSSESVNEALRFLVRVTQENQSALGK